MGSVPRLPNRALARLSLTLLLLALGEQYAVCALPTFERTFNFSGNDYGSRVVALGDGGCVVAATVTLAAGPIGTALMRMDSLGDTLWMTHFAEEQGGVACQARDGGFVTAASVHRSGSWTDIILHKMNGGGDSLWSTTFGTAGFDEPYDISATADGGVIVSAWYCDSPGGNGGIIKFDSAGALQWSRYLSDSLEVEPYSISQLRDGGYVVGGRAANRPAGSLFYLARLDSSGTAAWSLRGDTSYRMAVCADVVEARGGGYAASGIGLDRNADRYRVLVVSVGAAGDTLWTRLFAADTSEPLVGSICERSTGGYVVAGSTGGPEPDVRLFVMGCSADGESLWTRFYDGDDPVSPDGANDVVPATDGGCFITGLADFTSVYLIRADSTGQVTSGVADLPLPTLGSRRASSRVVRGGPSWSAERRVRLFDSSGRAADAGGRPTGRPLPAGVYFIRDELLGDVQRLVVVR